MGWIKVSHIQNVFSVGSETKGIKREQQQPPSVRVYQPLGAFSFKKCWDHHLSSDTWSFLIWLCFVSRLLSIHIPAATTFHILICPSVVFPSATLRTIIVFGASWPLSEMILFETLLWSAATLPTLPPTLTQAGAGCHTDPSPARCGHEIWAVQAVPLAFPFCVSKIRIIEDDVGTELFSGRLSI